MGHLFRGAIQQSNHRNRDKEVGPPLDGTPKQMRQQANSGHIPLRFPENSTPVFVYRTVNFFVEPRRNRTLRIQT
jgi:hypothetical protein